LHSNKLSEQRERERETADDDDAVLLALYISSFPSHRDVAAEVTFLFSQRKGHNTLKRFLD
jgi:hypothetical protein